MTVFENITFGLKVRPRKLRPSKKKIKEKSYLAFLKLVKLELLHDRFPLNFPVGKDKGCTCKSPCK